MSVTCGVEKICLGCIVCGVDTAALGRNIKRLRKRPELNIRAVDLAERMSVTKPVISNWENWKGDSLPDGQTLLRLAKALGASVDDLLEGVDPDYDAARAKTNPVTPIVIKHPPSQKGGADVPSRVEARATKELAKMRAEMRRIAGRIGELAETPGSDRQEAESTDRPVSGGGGRRRKPH